MHNVIRRLAVTIGLSGVLGSSLLVAQINSKRTTAEVPFDFKVLKYSLPSGNYEIREITSGGALGLWNQDTKQVVAVLPQSRKSGDPGNPRLIFHCYGSQCFLSEVWMGSNDYGQTFGPTRDEKRLTEARIPPVVASIRMK